MLVVLFAVGTLVAVNYLLISELRKELAALRAVYAQKESELSGVQEKLHEATQQISDIHEQGDESDRGRQAAEEELRLVREKFEQSETAAREMIGGLQQQFTPEFKKLTVHVFRSLITRPNPHLRAAPAPQVRCPVPRRPPAKKRNSRRSWRALSRGLLRRRAHGRTGPPRYRKTHTCGRHEARRDNGGTRPGVAAATVLREPAFRISSN